MLITHWFWDSELIDWDDRFGNAWLIFYQIVIKKKVYVSFSNLFQLFYINNLNSFPKQSNNFECENN